ncbi:peptidase C48 domain-containing protein [Encephalitozoon hellem ATCC 50504]|uniref:Sentrin/SUMO-specific protease SENP1 n=1 Tax=Encephalitozoon hellem TaxID=27973 RepID=A0A9Q9C9V9_ENCHE|nr:peptidase C48 domain-containing protein [Encephalitozoon hellem ATCC 50504]AFM98294.1 peptidase C48 domain-containing protein [Encephalitozoon hellem ATCC 50504]UTX43172.1 sentrin/SUMO-specific protease SENP1 [Encephalitozoon hellem]|eukprot:XP_003887275.1 peptidase C48 domain-containing protein [Encephalitozoon hellem ATCC 50504]
MDEKVIRSGDHRTVDDGSTDGAGMIPSTQEQLDAIAEACLKTPTTIKREGYELLPEDIERTKDGFMLNDKIINVYFELLAKHSNASVYVFSTFFYAALSRRGIPWVQRWTSRINIFESRLVYIPVHVPGHWILIVFDVRRRVLEHYDSMGSVYTEVVLRILRYIKDEWSRIYRKEPFLSVDIKKKIPLQRNGRDCGVFVCMFGRYRLCGSREWLSSDGIPRFRKLMLHEIVSGQILYEVFHQFSQVESNPKEGRSVGITDKKPLALGTHEEVTKEEGS